MPPFPQRPPPSPRPPRPFPPPSPRPPPPPPPHWVASGVGITTGPVDYISGFPSSSFGPLFGVRDGGDDTGKIYGQDIDVNGAIGWRLGATLPNLSDICIMSIPDAGYDLLAAFRNVTTGEGRLQVAPATTPTYGSQWSDVCSGTFASNASSISLNAILVPLVNVYGDAFIVGFADGTVGNKASAVLCVPSNGTTNGTHEWLPAGGPGLSAGAVQDLSVAMLAGLDGNALAFIGYLDLSLGKPVVQSFNLTGTTPSSWEPLPDIPVDGIATSFRFKIVLMFGFFPLPAVMYAESGNGGKGTMRLFWPDDSSGTRRRSLLGALSVSGLLTATKEELAANKEELAARALSLEDRYWQPLMDSTGQPMMSTGPATWFDMDFVGILPVVVYSDGDQGGKMSARIWSTQYDSKGNLQPVTIQLGSAGFTDGAVSHTTLVIDDSTVIWLGYRDEAAGGKLSIYKTDSFRGQGISVGCFPGHATVLLEGGSRKTMRQLAIGDRVHVLRSDGRLAYQPIYLFGHQEGDKWSSMVTLEAKSRTSNATLRLTLSPDHFVPVHGPSGTRAMTRALGVKVGDQVWAVPASGGQATLHDVTAISADYVQGLYNPFTAAGTIVVDGVVASVHSRWFLDGAMEALGLTHLIPALYQAIMLPGYYTVYCVLGPNWVRWLDARVDFANTGTDSPISTLLLLWAYMALVLAPAYLGACKVHTALGSLKLKSA